MQPVKVFQGRTQVHLCFDHTDPQIRKAFAFQRESEPETAFIVTYLNAPHFTEEETEVGIVSVSDRLESLNKLGECSLKT